MEDELKLKVAKAIRAGWVEHCVAQGWATRDYMIGWDRMSPSSKRAYMAMAAAALGVVSPREEPRPKRKKDESAV